MLLFGHRRRESSDHKSCLLENLILSNPLVAAGGSDPRILIRHILPNCISPIIVSAAVATAFAMLTESYLSFLGVGDPSKITWGQLLYDATFNLKAWWLIAFPGMALASAVISFNMAGSSK